MSKFVKVKTELRDLALVKQALGDLKLTYGENQTYSHVWSGTRRQVPVLIKPDGATFGLELHDGVYQVIGDDMQMAAIKRTLERVQQRYAYHKVRAEVEQAGFNLVEESVGKDNVIRMTVRRWS